MKARVKTPELNLTPQEQWIIDQFLKTWNLDLFTEYFFRLPNSGTRWMPNDAIGHYRHSFTYDLLYSGWAEAGRPEKTPNVKTPDYQYSLRVLWSEDMPHFLLPHSYLFLDWVRPVIDRKIIERTTRGKNAKANKVVGGGLTPYGYVYLDDRLVISEDEAQIVRMIYQWYIEGHLSLYAISAKLSEMRAAYSL